jgi:hypothetical protein
MKTKQSQKHITTTMKTHKNSIRHTTKLVATWTLSALGISFTMVALAQAQFAGTYSGTFSGDAYGTWNGVFDSAGNVTGSANTPVGVVYAVGQVTASGSISGSVDIGATFSGQIDSSGHVQGTWVYLPYGMYGTFSGRRTTPPPPKMTITLSASPASGGKVTGGGSFSPGGTHTVKVTTNSGFGFVNWMENGSVVSTTASYTFTLDGNRNLVATFTDVQRPTVTITNPPASSRQSNAMVNVMGTAKDNDRVTNVWVSVNGAGFVSAGTQNGWTNWTLVQQRLGPGTNLLWAYAADATGNLSQVATSRVVYVVSDRLVVQATGPCTMSPNYSNAVLEIGKSYTNTVTPGKGFVCSNWVGTVLGNVVLVSNTPKLIFTMQSNLVLQANIIPNPFIAVKGTYSGLFGQTNRAQDSSGFFTLTVTTNGAYSGSLKPGSSSYSLSGQFDVAGRASQMVSRQGSNAWGLGMTLDFAAQQLHGWVSNGVGGGWVADLLADRAVFDARANPATQYVGKYTLRIPGNTNEDGTVWFGDGYLTLGMDAGGKMTYSGSLADGTSVGPGSVPVSGEGYSPLYVPLYSGKGSVWSWLTFDANQPATGMGGWLSWIRPAQAGAYYPAGLTNQVMVEGARYTPPASTTNRVIELTNGVVIFEGGNLVVPLTNAVMLTPTNKVIDLSLTNRLSLSLTVSNGTFAGSVREPGLTRSNSFKGVLLQNENSGYGYFLETNRSGRVLFWPAP